jgi:CheY-like chemotaxis protein
MAGQADILIVDDDPLQREILSEMLAGAGYACRTAEDGEVAIERLSEAPADLVVLDMLMPNKEGIETLREIRRRWPATRVVMVSTGTRVMPAHSLLHAATSLGADAGVAKPLRAADFLPLVADLLSGRPAAV